MGVSLSRLSNPYLHWLNLVTLWHFVITSNFSLELTAMWHFAAHCKYCSGFLWLETPAVLHMDTFLSLFVLATLAFLMSSTSTSATETSLTATSDGSCFSPVINNQVGMTMDPTVGSTVWHYRSSLPFSSPRHSISSIFNSISFLHIVIHIRFLSIKI